MTDNLPNISLTSSEPTDLYAGSGITVGVQLEIQNIGSSDIILYSQLAEPLLEDGQQIIRRGEFLVNEIGDSGAWALSPNQDGLLNVKAAI